ncbi:hypothetical protein Tco_1320730 [Tanacetum coccineum]
MSSITAQQAKLDLELVPKEKRLEIGKCNRRINPGKTQREPTFQVVSDALALTPCYSAFLTTRDVPEICPRVHGQDFDELPTDEVIVSFFKELGHTGEIKSITDVVVDHMHKPWRNFATIINRSLSGKTIGVDKLQVPDKSKAKSSDTNEGTGVKPGVPDVPTVDSFESTENDDDSGNHAQDSERTDSDEEENPNLNLNVDEEEETQKEEYVHTTDYSVPTGEEIDDENIEFDDEEYDDLYKDVNVRSKVAEHKEVGKGDVEMTDVARESGSQENSYEQVVEDAHVTLTTSQKTEGSKKSSFVSSDFASKFPILDNVPPVVDEVANFYCSCNNRSSNNSTPTPEPTTEPSTNLIPTLPDFSSLFGFDHRVSNLENELSKLKRVGHSTQILSYIISEIPAMVDDHLSTRNRFAPQTDLQSYMAEFV